MSNIKEKNQRKSKLISFRINEEEEQYLFEKAAEAKISVSAFCRRKVQGTIVKAPSPLAPIADIEMNVHLKEIAGRLKEMNKAGRGVDVETQQELQEILIRISNRLNSLR